MKTYFKWMKLHVKSEFEYKVSFILNSISQIFVFFTYYYTIIALFNRFDNIMGFTKFEVLLNFSIIHFGYSFVELFARGIDRFDKLIISGDYDRLLLRPENIIMQAMIHKFDIFKLVRVLQAAIIFVITLLNLNITWTIYKAFIVILCLICSIILFLGLFLIAASYCFFTIEGLEFKNLLTDGGKQLAQYPISIYKKGFMLFFTFIIPYGLITYYPLIYVLGKTDNYLYGLLPLFSIVFLGVGILIFKLTSRRYQGTGS